MKRLFILMLFLILPGRLYGEETTLRSHSIPLMVTITADKTSYEWGEGIKIELHLKNLSEETLLIDTYGWPYAGLDFKITDNAGAECVPKESGFPLPDRQESNIVQLDPMKELVFDISENLTRFYGRLDAGSYNILIELKVKYRDVGIHALDPKVAGFTEALLVSDYITIEVRQKKEKLVFHPGI